MGRISRAPARENHGLDAGICRQAIISRDPRFDGRFFAGAATTRLYCRNVCPIPFAGPGNLVLFTDAAAAEAAGFRPCKRCQPQAAPGTAAWRGTSAVVSRGVRLILEGALNEGSVEQLAGKLGLGSRQLRRLFVQHLGASPLKIASTHRVHLARILIDESTLPVSEIAFSSGFRSIREFNHAVRSSTGRTPVELRRAAGLTKIPGRLCGLELRFTYRKPFDWDHLIAFLKPRAIPGVEVITENSYQRTIESGGAPGFLTVRHDDAGSCVVVHLEMWNYTGLAQTVEKIRRMFDLDAVPVQIGSHLSRDPVLRPLVDRRPGLRVPGAWDGFEAAVLGVLGQTITSPGPRRVVERMVQMFGKPVNTPIRGMNYLFPRPEVLATADLSKAGVSAACAGILRRLARPVILHQLTFATPGTLEQTISRLSSTCGTGESTANYIVLRAMGEPDAFPAGDPGLGHELAGTGASLTSLQLIDLAKRWRPWRAYAAMHLASR